MSKKIKTAYEWRVHKRSCAYHCPEPNCPRDPMTRERDIQQVVNINKIRGGRNSPCLCTKFGQTDLNY